MQPYSNAAPVSAPAVLPFEASYRSALASSEVAWSCVWQADLLLERLGDFAGDPNPVTLRLLQGAVTRTTTAVEAAKAHAGLLAPSRYTVYDLTDLGNLVLDTVPADLDELTDPDDPYIEDCGCEQGVR